jgi:hypothetical protein
VSPRIEASLFDFIDELADGVRGGRLDREDLLEQDSAAMTFCEGFFDQFFATLGHNIRGFGVRAKRDASALVEQLRQTDESSSKQVRVLIAMYEAFCDMSDDIKGSYGDLSITYEAFHGNYLLRLLPKARDWAESVGDVALAERIVSACDNYTAAIEASEWLTKQRRSGSVLRRLILRRRTNS